MPQKGRRRKKSRTHLSANENEAGQTALQSKQDEKIPKSLVIRRGKTASEVEELVQDLRHLMLPYTALHFQEDPKNRKLTLNQYATHLALPMGISHILSFSQKEERLHFRLARTPVGPTLSFRVHQFSLNRHIKGLQRRPVSHSAGLANTPPVVVTNNFGDAKTATPETKLMRITFQNMFPSINVATVKLTDCRRVVLFNLVDHETVNAEGEPVVQKRVEMRHFCIKATPAGVHRRVRRLIQSKVPNLNKCQDIADYLDRQGGIASDAASDSEPEDDPTVQVQLPDRYVGRGNAKAQKSALKLIEIGPRLSLELLKVEKGLGGGDVLYHAHVKKSAAEAAALTERKAKERAQKEGRKAQQQANVDRKRSAAEEKREAKRQRTKERQEAAMQALRQGGSGVAQDSDDESEENESEQEESS